jgi:hypothetical protein
MIGKVMAGGKGAGGLVRYVTQERDEARSLTEYVTGDQHEIGAIAYRNLLAENPKDAAQEMALVAKLSSRCEKPFMHVQLSWHPEERPSNEQMIEAMDRTLAKLGLDDRQAVYAIHLEKHHVHIHAAINRVGADGLAWRDFRSAERFIEASREVEREMGFINRDLQIERARLEGHSSDPRPTPRQQRIAERSGVEPDLSYQERLQEYRERAGAFAERIKTEAKAALRFAQTWAEAHGRLAQHGLGLREFVSPNNQQRKGLEVVEIATGERCAASDLGSDYGRAKLEKRLGAFERGPENMRLEALRRDETPRLDRNPSQGRSGPSAGQETRKAGVCEDSSLWQDYQADRLRRSAERERALDRQRTHERERREALRRERAAERERLWAGGLRGAAWKAVRSELAFEYAKARQILDETIASERAELRRDYRPRTWTEFVVERAAAGDNRAIAQIATWNRSRARKLEQPFVLEQPDAQRERTTPVARKLSDLQYDVNRRTGDVTYRWERDGCEAFTDYGSKIAIKDGQDRDAIRAALELSRAKWGKEVSLHGTAEFKKIATEIATEMRMTIANVEMREYQQQLVAQREAQERAWKVERERLQAWEREREAERLCERERAELREQSLEEHDAQLVRASSYASYHGQVVGVDRGAGLVFQQTGKDVVAHELAKFQAEPPIGKDLEITYGGSRVDVREREPARGLELDQEQGRGMER